MGLDVGSRTIIIDDNCPVISIRYIYEDNETSCEYMAGQACENIHTFIPKLENVTGEVIYEWSTSHGIIIGNTTDNYFIVSILSNQDIAYEISLKVMDMVSGAEATYQFTSQHSLSQKKDCIFAWTDGIWDGYEKDSYGTGEFETEDVYAIKWRIDDNRFVIRMGDGGESILPDCETVDIDYLGIKHYATWNSSELWYECNSTELLSDLEAEYEVCNRKYCFSLFFLRNLTISTDLMEVTNESI